MPKSRKRIDATTGQGSLFDLLTRAQAAAVGDGRPAGSMDVRNRLRGALVGALKRCPLSRWEVAGRMSELIGMEISKFQIDAWTAESKDNHRFPAEYLPAFCEATGDSGPLQILGETAGLFVLPGPEALRAEIQRLTEEERRIKGERKKREQFLREMRRSR
jgi:hypothetical protein